MTTKTSRIDPRIPDALDAIRRRLGDSPLPSVSLIAVTSRDPFRILISTMISLRTKDEITLTATRRLFDCVQTPEQLAGLPESRISELIYPCGFYRTKAASIRAVARLIVTRHGGVTPDDLSALLAFPGVGRKTANLVLGLGFGIPAICVDTHVHRIANRLAWISAKTPDESELMLQAIVPRQRWIELNELLVLFGQQICTPQSPWCSQCPLAPGCPRVDVTRSR